MEKESANRIFRLSRPARKPVARISAAAIILLSFSVSVACAADKLRVGRVNPRSFNFGMLDAGIKRGIFQKYELEIALVDIPGGAKLHQAMTAGSIDVAMGGGTDLPFLIKGAPEKAVAVMQTNPANLAFIVKSDSPIKTLGGLKGKSVGATTVGSLTSWIAMEVARRQGWGADGVKLVYLGDMSGMLAGLTTGAIDAASGNLEVSYALQGEGKFRILLKGGDLIRDFVAGIIYASDLTIAGQPDALRRFLKAWFETVAYIHNNKPEVIQMMANIMSASPNVTENIYDDEMPSMSLDGRFEQKSLHALEQALVDVGLIDKMPDDSGLINQAFLP